MNMMCAGVLTSCRACVFALSATALRARALEESLCANRVAGRNPPRARLPGRAARARPRDRRRRSRPIACATGVRRGHGARRRRTDSPGLTRGDEVEPPALRGRPDRPSATRSLVTRSSRFDPAADTTAAGATDACHRCRGRGAVPVLRAGQTTSPGSCCRWTADFSSTTRVGLIESLRPAAPEETRLPASGRRARSPTAA